MSAIGEVLFKSPQCWPSAPRQRRAPVPSALKVFWDANPSCGVLAGFATETQKLSNLSASSTPPQRARSLLGVRLRCSRVAIPTQKLEAAAQRQT